MTSNLRVVKVFYQGGGIITTSMASHLTDDDINSYFRIGRVFNIGSSEDSLRVVERVEILN